ncbi:MAG: aminopeptidase P family protein [Phycisphaerales bacterium]|nr:aminopeptidase P family protein [Phycisphaerales bacterium]
MLHDLQRYMSDHRIDAWLIYDFRASNPVLAQLFPPPLSPAGAPTKRWTTRRVYALIPARGTPRLLVSAIDAAQFAALPSTGESAVEQTVYISWKQMHEWLHTHVAPCARVAMEYVPGGDLPAMSFADAGTVEFIRALGGARPLDVVSSADLVQVSIARWSPDAVRLHDDASTKVAAIKDDAFALIRSRLRANQPIHEHEVGRFIMDAFAKAGLITNDEPVVAANAHAGDPHYGPSPERPTPIRKGDWILIDLWARHPGESNIFADITWCGCAVASQSEVPAQHRKAFETVKAARDASLKLAMDSWGAPQKGAGDGGGGVQGWQLDDAAYQVIVAAGYEPFIRHRTGHSLSGGPLVHGLGMNLDNLETHDTRLMLPGIGFTIEPGVYTPELGARLEINIYVDPKIGPRVTSPMQDDVVLVG